MAENRLYKYLDADGGLMMLYYSTLMFTNATQLNDLFDCHPVLRDLSATPASVRRGMHGEIFSKIEYNKGLMRRETTYICSLSKLHDSILMWSYYSKHSGICIGLDMEKTRTYLNRMNGLFLGCPELEVQYRDVVNEPQSIKGSKDFLCYHFATKAKEWEHEQEVRLIAYDPSSEHMRLLPGQYEEDKSICSKFKKLFCTQKGMEKSMDWKEVRAFLEIGGECFESIYLGINMANKDKEKMIKVAKERNPNIKIYQMTIDPEAFKLKEEQI